MHLKFNISDTHIWWKGSSRLNSNSTFQNYFPLGSPYFITCFPCWSIVFLPYDYPLGSSYVYHMISLLGLLYSNHTISLLDPRILSHDFPLGSSYFYHMISLLDPRMFTTWFHSWDSCILTTRFSSWILVFLPHDFPLGSFYFFHMISFLNLCIFTTLFSSLVPRIFITWFPSWIFVFLPHDFLYGSSYYYHMISLLDPRILFYQTIKSVWLSICKFHNEW